MVETSETCVAQVSPHDRGGLGSIKGEGGDALPPQVVSRNHAADVASLPSASLSGKTTQPCLLRCTAACPHEPCRAAVLPTFRWYCLTRCGIRFVRHP